MRRISGSGKSPDLNQFAFLKGVRPAMTLHPCSDASCQRLRLEVLKI